MSYEAPSDFTKIIELKAEQDKIRDILFFQSIHGVSQSNPFGIGGKNPAFGSKLGADSWFPLEATITDVNEALVSTGIFDKLNIQSIANVIVGPIGTLILKTIKNISDGKIFSITPGVGRTVEITPGGGGGDDGKGIEVASTLTLTDKDMVFMQYFKDTDKVKIIAGGTTVTGANKTLSNLVSPVAFNQHFIPNADNLLDIASSAKRIRDVFTHDLRIGSLGAGVGGARQVYGTSVGVRFNTPSALKFFWDFNNLVKFDMSSSSFTGPNIILSDTLTINNSSGDPTANGQLRRNVNDLKVQTGGVVKNFTQMAELDKVQNWTAIQTFIASITNINSATINIGDAVTDKVNFTARVGTDFDPFTDNANDLGGDAQRWQNLFLARSIDLKEGFAVGFAPTGQTDRAILFSRPDGSGKTQLRVKFQTGTSVLIAIEP